MALNDCAVCYLIFQLPYPSAVIMQSTAVLYEIHHTVLYHVYTGCSSSTAVHQYSCVLVYI